MCVAQESYEVYTAHVHYKESLVAGQIWRAASVPHVEALQPRPPKQPLNRTPLVVTFHPLLTKLAGITRRHLPILDTQQHWKAVQHKNTYHMQI